VKVEWNRERPIRVAILAGVSSPFTPGAGPAGTNPLEKTMKPSSRYQLPSGLPPNLYSLSDVLGGVVAAAFIQAHMDLCLSWLEEQGLYFDMTLQRWMKAQSQLQYHATALANLPLEKVKEPAYRLTRAQLEELFQIPHTAEGHQEASDGIADQNQHP